MCSTGSRLIVMTPSAPGLLSTTAMMRALGGRVHLQDAIAAPGADPLDTVSEAVQPGCERVRTEVPLDDEGCGGVRLEPADPPQQQVVQALFPETHRRVRVHAGEADRLRHCVRFGWDDVGRSSALGVACAQVECPVVDIDSPDPCIRL